MQVASFTPVEYFGSNTYILHSYGRAVVIDPSIKYSELREFIESNSLTVKYVILTHAHFDHFTELDSWVENTDAVVIVGEKDAEGLADSTLNCYRQFAGVDRGYYGSYQTVKEGDKLLIGDNSLRIIETPGHTQGSITIYCGDSLFVGDVMFRGGGIGRCDLPGGDYGMLESSIKRLLTYPDETLVYSGHGNKTKIKELKRYLG